MCTHLFNCFFSTPPQLQVNPQNWSLDSLRTNLVAVPLSMDVEKLKKIKKAAKHYLTRPDILSNKQQAIPLLQELNRVTKKQLEIAKYSSSTKKVHDLIHTPLQEDEAVFLWEQIKLKILYRENDIQSLAQKSALIEDECSNHKTLLLQLNVLFNLCRSAYIQKMDQRVFHPSSQNSNDEVWSNEKIKQLATSLPQMHGGQLKTLMNAITQQQSIHHDQILDLTNQLDHCTKVHEALMTNIEDLIEMEKQLGSQFIALTTIPLLQQGSFL